MNKFSGILIITLFGILSCKNSGNEKPTKEIGSQMQDSMVEVNKLLVRKDAERIKAYVKRRGWEMIETKTGLWYSIYEKGEGKLAEKGMVATLVYSVELLDGTPCYHSDKDGLKQFKISEGGVESGLEEGILLLREGDKARFIMPPHLAHGLIGDENCIPARATIVYEVTLLNLSENLKLLNMKTLFL
ncbi:MAG: peptidylprolyl isomerase [Bacteroidales bacterium]|nr:peptidylprolyl isomerase [Bacteroidales bacterium]